MSTAEIVTAIITAPATLVVVALVGNALSRFLRAHDKPAAALAVDKATAFAVAQLHEPEKVSALVELAKGLEEDHSAVAIAKVIAKAYELEKKS